MGAVLQYHDQPYRCVDSIWELYRIYDLPDSIQTRTYQRPGIHPYQGMFELMHHVGGNDQFPRVVSEFSFKLSFKNPDTLRSQISSLPPTQTTSTIFFS